MFEEGKRAAYPPGVALPRRAKLVEKGRKTRFGKATPFIHPLGNRQQRRAMGLMPNEEWRETLRELRRMNKDDVDDELDAVTVTYDPRTISVRIGGATVVGVEDAPR